MERFKVTTRYPDGEETSDIVYEENLEGFLEDSFTDAIVRDYGIGPDPGDEESDRAAVADALDSLWSTGETIGGKTEYRYSTVDDETTVWIVEGSEVFA